MKEAIAKAASVGYEAKCPHCGSYDFGLTRSEAELARQQHAAQEHPGKDLATAAPAKPRGLSGQKPPRTWLGTLKKWVTVPE